MLANVGLKPPEYESSFLSQPEVVQTQLDVTFKVLVDAMNAEAFCDLLGNLYVNRSTVTRKNHCSFFTPPGVANFMSLWAVADAPRDEPFNLLEPSAGSGGLVLAAANMFTRQGRDLEHLHVVAYDADLTACHCAYINTTLWEISCLVRHGSFEGLEFDDWPNLWLLKALREEETDGESSL